jgi:type II secretory ATPase GspE/PulE/Tfp pilus assembly ATPase PilB-like protein
MGVEGFLVSSSLAGVLSQRLVRTICKECEGSGINFNFTGNRCKNCSGTGFRGRTGIFELLLVDDDIRSAILRNAPSTEIAAIAVSKGMMPLNEYGMLKVKDGVTTAEEVLMATIDNE